MLLEAYFVVIDSTLNKLTSVTKNLAFVIIHHLVLTAFKSGLITCNSLYSSVKGVHR